MTPLFSVVLLRVVLGLSVDSGVIGGLGVVFGGLGVAFGAFFSGVGSPCLLDLVGFGPIVRGVFSRQRGASLSLVKKFKGMSHASVLEYLPEGEGQQRTGAARFCFQSPGYTGQLYGGGEIDMPVFVTNLRGDAIRLTCLFRLIKEKMNMTRTEFSHTLTSIPFAAEPLVKVSPVFIPGLSPMLWRHQVRPHQMPIIL